ncbi:hypothetical protein BGP75_11705 [Motiliproteus sp. MSK22-1]|nr:hypothetical protein BGP75_11705 [Motiliproteus sp. MSK22-1]
MLMLLIMLFFTVTGLTLNHRDWLPDPPALQVQELLLPAVLQDSEAWYQDPLSQAVHMREWLRTSQGIYGVEVSYDWQTDEQLLLIDMKRPGGYSLVEVQPATGVLVLENQDYGVIAILNDLHMGRYSGTVWRVFIDISALLMLLFTLTGLWLVLPQKKRRQRLLYISGLGMAIMATGYLWVLKG